MAWVARVPVPATHRLSRRPPTGLSSQLARAHPWLVRWQVCAKIPSHASGHLRVAHASGERPGQTMRIGTGYTCRCKTMWQGESTQSRLPQGFGWHKQAHTWAQHGSREGATECTCYGFALRTHVSTSTVLR